MEQKTLQSETTRLLNEMDTEAQAYKPPIGFGFVKQSSSQCIGKGTRVMEKETLVCVTCRTCMTPKAIMQGSGKRKEFVYGYCECGPDNRTGKPAQLAMKSFNPLADIELEIETIKTVNPS